MYVGVGFCQRNGLDGAATNLAHVLSPGHRKEYSVDCKVISYARLADTSLNINISTWIEFYGNLLHLVLIRGYYVKGVH